MSNYEPKLIFYSEFLQISLIVFHYVIIPYSLHCITSDPKSLFVQYKFKSY